MAISTFPTWEHALSGYYKIPVRTARSLHCLGLLPSAGDASAIDKPTAIDLNDSDAVEALEECRSRFDTPLAPFVDSLRDVGHELISNTPEWPHETRLVEFRCFSYGRIDAAYPCSPHWMPWRRHRAAVTRAELIAAGYPALRALWGYAGDDPFASVPIGGEIPLGHPGWVDTGYPRPNINMQRGAFLLRLADILEARS